MIQKIFESYDNNNYYIDTNKKKLAYDNISVIGGMLTFFIVVGLIFVAVAIAFGNGLNRYYEFIPVLGVLAVLLFIYKKIGNKVNKDFDKARIFSLIIYATIILSLSIADSFVYSSSRAVVFPVAIVLLSAIYLDYFWILLLFKVSMAVVFLVVNSRIKVSDLLVSDATIAILAIMASTFCYTSIINTALSSHEGSEQLVKKSETDLLTGLLNKISFEEKCTEYLNARHTGAKGTLFIFDLDDFKHVNDNYGHQVGDKTLQLFAEILKGYFHPDDVIGRVGGDEFMVLVLGDMPEGFAERRCRSVLHELKTTEIEGAKGITCSIGIAMDTQGHNFEEMYQKADEALYKSKEGGKARFFMEVVK